MTDGKLVKKVTIFEAMNDYCRDCPDQPQCDSYHNFTGNCISFQEYVDENNLVVDHKYGVN